MTNLRKLYCLSGLSISALAASPAFAQVASNGIFDDIEARYRAAAAGWAATLTGYASTLFIALAIISMVFTFGIMAIRRADLGEFFAEFVRYLLFTGFFLWLLQNGPAIGSSIIQSMQQMGQTASGLGTAVTPSSIVDIGFDILNRMITQSSVWQPVDSAIGILISIAVLITLALVAVNMLLLLISGWILAYGGIFFLGFGGSRWTSDFAINYFKTLLGVAGSLFGMVLIVGIGKSFLDQYYAAVGGAISIHDVAVVLVVCVILLFLVNKIPQLISGILTGASVGAGSLVASAGAGTALAAGATAGAALATGGAALAAGAANIAGGASALSAAFGAAQSSISGGGSSGSSGSGSMGGDAGAGGGGGGGGSSGGGSPMSNAMGGSSGSGGFTPGRSAIGNVARAGGSMAADAWRAKVGATVGGQIAERIRSASADTSSSPAFTGDAIGGGGGSTTPAPQPANDEVAAFVNKG